MNRNDCRHCGKKLRLRFASDKEWVRRNNSQKKLGPNMDGFFCSYKCGYKWAVGHIEMFGLKPSVAP